MHIDPVLTSLLIYVLTQAILLSSTVTLEITRLISCVRVCERMYVCIRVYVCLSVHPWSCHCCDNDNHPPTLDTRDA